MSKTSISVSQETKERILKLGLMGETYDTALNRLLDELERFRDAQGIE